MSRLMLGRQTNPMHSAMLQLSPFGTSQRHQRNYYGEWKQWSQSAAPTQPLAQRCSHTVNSKK
jgi:hypothetical protein